MRKKLIIVLCVIILVVIAGIFAFKKSHIGDIMDGPGMVNDVPYYNVITQDRGDNVGEDIYVYDENDNLVLSLEDKDEPQYFFALYENYLVLDSGTSASERDMIVYDIKSGDKIFETDYYPGEDGLVLNDNNVILYKEIDKDLYGDYTLPDCENEYDNGYIENYGYTIGEHQINDLGDIKCAYFE